MRARAARSTLLRRAPWVALLWTALGLAPAIPAVARAAEAAAGTSEGWLEEFEEVCSRTQDAMAIPDDELRALVKRCDALKPRIEALDASRRKVYGKRLQLCRDLYQFVLDARAGAK